MAATSGTRRGTGKGHGGPKQGEGWGGAPQGASTSRLDGSPLSDAIRALARDPRHAASKEVAREAVLMTWAGVMLDSENDGHRVLAGDKIMERLDGKAAGTMLVGGAEGAQPIVIERRIIDPAGD